MITAKIRDSLEKKGENQSGYTSVELEINIT